MYVEAEAGESSIQAPSTALAEVFYAVSRDRAVSGVQLAGSPADARQAFLANAPVSLTPVAEQALAEYVQVVDECGIYDGLLLANHSVHGTEAVITSGGAIQAAGVATI